MIITTISKYAMIYLAYMHKVHHNKQMQVIIQQLYLLQTTYAYNYGVNVENMHADCIMVALWFHLFLTSSTVDIYIHIPQQTGLDNLYEPDTSHEAILCVSAHYSIFSDVHDTQ